MKFSNISKLALLPFAIALFFLRPDLARAAEGFSKDSLGDSSKETIDPKADIGLGKFAAFPFHVSVSVRGGYDDNVNLSSFNPQESWFVNTALNLTYEFGSPRTRISLNSGVSFTYYFDHGDDSGFDNNNRDYDINAWLGFSITHKATPRLTLGASVYATYQTQPDFETFNNINFSFGRQSQDYFFTVDKFSAGYAWTPRFSTVTSFTFGVTDYVDDNVSQFEDRFEYTFGNEFRFLVWPTTTLVAEYRFGIIDYMHNSGRDSTSNYLLGGFDHSFSPRFNISVRAGAEFRNYDNNLVNAIQEFNGNDTSPYFEGTLNYSVSQDTSVSWTNRYSLEESDVPEFLNTQTYRTALSVRHAWTPRISTGVNFAYEHDDYAGNFINPSFTEDSFEVSLWARYAINRNFAFDLGYTYTDVISDTQLFREYSRNRYYAGVTFTW